MRYNNNNSIIKTIYLEVIGILVKPPAFGRYLNYRSNQKPKANTMLWQSCRTGEAAELKSRLPQHFYVIAYYLKTNDLNYLIDSLNLNSNEKNIIFSSTIKCL